MLLFLCRGCIWARFRCADPPTPESAPDDANTDAAGKPNGQNRSVATRTCLLLRHENRRALVLQKKHDELRGLGLARVAPDGMYVVRTFIKGLPRRERDFLTALDLHHDRSLQHIDE